MKLRKWVEEVVGDYTGKYLSEACACELVEAVLRPIEVSQDTQKAVAAERDACIALIRQYLLFDSQRAVSWHEVQDLLAEIRNRGKQ